MDIQGFKAYFDPTFSKFLRTKIDETKNISKDPILRGALEVVFDLYAHSGKRVRPYAMYLMYKSAGGNNDDISMASIASELQHAFALVHDDIIDKGELRHGDSTIQVYVQGELESINFAGDVVHQANSHAMLVGDLMLIWSCEAMNQIERQNKPRLISLFLEMARKSVSGELLDISIQARESAPESELSLRDLLKTSADTFINPMLIGAALANRERDFELFCQKFGALMGEVFQIQDDILDILGEEGTPEHSDIKERQHTFLTQHVLKNGTPEEKRVLHEFFARSGNQIEVESEVLKILSQTHIINYAKQESYLRLTQAKEELRTAQFSQKYENLWLDLIAIFEKRFVSK